jgi:hypothetical protein
MRLASIRCWFALPGIRVLVGPTGHLGAGWPDLASGCWFDGAGIWGGILDRPSNYPRQGEAHHPSTTRRQSNGSIDRLKEDTANKTTSVQKAEDIILLLINNQKTLVSTHAAYSFFLLSSQHLYLFFQVKNSMENTV